jgi:hypothetical protein
MLNFPELELGNEADNGDCVTVLKAGGKFHYGRYPLCTMW